MDDICLNVEPVEARFYNALGLAMTKWQVMETALAEVFFVASTITNSQIAAAIFYSARDFSVKLSLTNAAIAVGIDDSATYVKWKSAMKMLTANNSLRNKLAHYQKIAIVGSEPGIEPSVILMQNFFDPNNYLSDEGEEAPTFDAEDILRIAGEFEKKGLELAQFSVELKALLERGGRP